MGSPTENGLWQEAKTQRFVEEEEAVNRGLNLLLSGNPSRFYSGQRQKIKSARRGTFKLLNCSNPNNAVKIGASSFLFEVSLSSIICFVFLFFNVNVIISKQLLRSSSPPSLPTNPNTTDA